MSHSGHNPSTSPDAASGFEVQIERWEGHRVRAVVELTQTLPPGTTSLSVLYDPKEHRAVEVVPWRNLSVFVIEELDRLAGVGSGAH